jgi:transmembrane sensor
MSDANKPTAKDKALAEATVWRVHLTEQGAETSEGFELWLTEPGHAEAWAQISNTWDYLGEQANEAELVAARQAALGDARRAQAVRRRPANWRTAGQGIAAALLLGLIAFGGYWWITSPDDYETAIGERRVVTLADGSRVSLDSNSEVTVRYTKNARDLHLVRGQARFDVAHNVERPFSVIAGDQKVVATGTAFNIDVTGPKVLVTLIEGHVVVLDEDKSKTINPIDTPSPLPKPSVELKAGQQLAALPEAPPTIATANLQRVTAWTSGQLMFDNETLADVVARVNRYTKTPIQIDGPKVANLKISGVFNTGDIAGFVDTVTHYLPVEAVLQDDGHIALKTKS